MTSGRDRKKQNWNMSLKNSEKVGVGQNTWMWAYGPGDGGGEKVRVGGTQDQVEREIFQTSDGKQQPEASDKGGLEGMCGSPRAGLWEPCWYDSVKISWRLRRKQTLIRERDKGSQSSKSRSQPRGILTRLLNFEDKEFFRRKKIKPGLRLLYINPSTWEDNWATFTRPCSPQNGRAKDLETQPSCQVSTDMNGDTELSVQALSEHRLPQSLSTLPDAHRAPGAQQGLGVWYVLINVHWRVQQTAFVPQTALSASFPLVPRMWVGKKSLPKQHWKTPRSLKPSVSNPLFAKAGKVKPHLERLSESTGHKRVFWYAVSQRHCICLLHTTSQQPSVTRSHMPCVTQNRKGQAREGFIF